MFLSIWSYKVSIKRIFLEFSFAMICSFYLFFLAFKSPCPPFLDTWIGSFLSVLASILSQCFFMRVRCLISTRLERFGESKLIWFGFFSIAGEVFGGIFTYILIEHMRLLKELPECSIELNCNI